MVNVTWSFQTLNNVDYELVIKGDIGAGFFNKMFGLAKRRAEKKGLKVVGDPSSVKRFAADKIFFNIARTTTAKTAKEAFASVAKDGVKVVSGEISNVFFDVEGSKRTFTVLWRGLYEAKR